MRQYYVGKVGEIESEVIMMWPNSSKISSLEVCRRIKSESLRQCFQFFLFYSV